MLIFCNVLIPLACSLDVLAETVCSACFSCATNPASSISFLTRAMSTVFFENRLKHVCLPLALSPIWSQTATFLSFLTVVIGGFFSIILMSPWVSNNGFPYLVSAQHFPTLRVNNEYVSPGTRLVPVLTVLPMHPLCIRVHASASACICKHPHASLWQ